MIYKTNVRHDAFSFSLAGVSAMAPYMAPPIVASDRITKARNAEANGGAKDGPAPSQGAGNPRLSWLGRIGSRLAWGATR
jgi:hypothetical protein